MRQKTSEGICHCGPPGRKTREHVPGEGGAPGTPEQGPFSPSQAAGEVPGPPTYSSEYTSGEGAKHIQFGQGVQGTREAPGVENTENNKIRSWEVCKLVGEKETRTREKRHHSKRSKQLYLTSVDGLSMRNQKAAYKLYGSSLMKVKRISLSGCLGGSVS